MPFAWLIPLLIAGAWLQLQPFWLSDDWIAIEYAQDWRRALADFGGNQYGLSGAVWFYRPLVTLSWTLQLAVAGTEPLVGHLVNAVSHGVGAMLLGMLAARFFGAQTGFWSAIVWGVLPLHAGAVLWTAGRTATLCIPWILASALLAARWCDGSRSARWWALLCFAVALGTKEIAVVTPGIVAVVCYAAAEPGERWRRAALGTAPFAALLALMLAGRWWLLGRVFGGYGFASLDPAAALGGLATWTARVANPAATLGPEGLAPLDLPTAVLDYAWVGLLPAAAAAVLLLAQRYVGALIALALLFVGLCTPCLQLWAQTGDAHNVRVFSLPAAAVAVLIGSGRAWTALPAVALAVLPLMQAREHYRQAYEESERTWRLIATEAPSLPEGPVLVAGLPRKNAAGDVVLFHLGVDRLLAPPFGDGTRRALALRPLVPGPDAPRLPYGDEFGLPVGTTAAAISGTGFGLLPPAPLRKMDARLDDVSQLDPETLWRLHRGEQAPVFVASRPASHYRITAFTAGGYVTAVLPNEAPADADSGRVSLARWLEAETSPNAFVVTDLVVPAVLDLELGLPVMVEAGQLADGSARFRATHVGRALLELRLTREYAPFIGDR
ncbi:MAG: hypothetical protein AAF628_09320 [Planctomycetota bacterium]